VPYRRYDVVIVDFLMGTGREQDGRRPALVISNDAFNLLDKLLTVVPFTSNPRQVYATELEFQPPVGGLETRSILMTSQINTVSVLRVVALLGRIEDPVAQRQINAALATHLSLPGALQ
jgi:mRNA interferase MazF